MHAIPRRALPVRLFLPASGRPLTTRRPSLLHAVRAFALGAFSLLAGDVERGEELPYTFEQHASGRGPALYEYRPLIRAYVEARAERLRAREDARIAVEELRREPAAGIFARAHAGAKPDETQAVFSTVLLPLVVSVAEACGGFDWDDRAFDRAYEELERSLFGSRRTYVAIAPLVGLSVGTQLELGDGVRVRVAAAGELSAHWPEASGLLPRDFGREPDRSCVLELERELALTVTEPPEAPGEIADAVTAIRLAAAAPAAAGPVLFERLDWRPYGIRPVLPIAATPPAGDPVRLDAVRARLAATLRARLALADEDAELGDALDRWELSLFQPDPFRAEQLRAALCALLGRGDGHWAASIRTAQLLGETGRERVELHARLQALAGGGPSDRAADAVRRALVETLVHGERPRLLGWLDDSLLGARPRPARELPADAASRLALSA